MQRACHGASQPQDQGTRRAARHDHAASPAAPLCCAGAQADACLYFSYTPDASGGAAVALQPGGLAAARQKEVDMFIRNFGSVAAFTANLTLELFQSSQQRGG
jgi:hypothetical protein